MQQGRIFDIINEMIKEKAGLETKEAQELKKTLAESNKGDLMHSEGLADTIGVALEKAEQIIDVLVEMGIIESIPFGNKVKSLVKTANKLYRIVRD